MRTRVLLVLLAFPLLASASEGLHEAHGSSAAFPWGHTGILMVNGPVDPDMLTSLQSGLELFPPSIQTIEMTLDSGGGQNTVGLQIVELLREQKRKGRHIIARVKNGAVCASMCLPIFLQGDERLAGPAASFMFHAVHSSAGYGGITQPEKTAAYLEYFRQAGVSETWLANARKDGTFDSPQPTWYNGRELLEEDSGIVLGALPRREEMRSVSIFGQTIWF